MEFLNKEIGSAKDNLKSPIHNWYKFTAGFSYKFVDEIISIENLAIDKNAKVFDPFAGCGTTLVSCQKQGVSAVGNEAQEFMYDIIRAKLNWKLEKDEFENCLKIIRDFTNANFDEFDRELAPHPLLKTLYTHSTLTKLYLIKEGIASLNGWKYKLFFRLALSQTLHKVSIHPIAIPYIVRSKFLTNTGNPWEMFENICRKMFLDLSVFISHPKTSHIYLQDSRVENRHLQNGVCTSCITSPPYLNNLDYGEVSKVHSHFFDITNNWNDITQKVRKKLVTGSTTHYAESDFAIENFKMSDFYLNDKKIAQSLIKTSLAIKEVSKERLGKKSFDVLALLYFKDMYHVLTEIRRVVKKDCNSYLILGDSAPYGIHIPTTEILGRMSRSAGFKEFQIHKIRTRGTKWKSLTYRHSLELSENVLILK